MINEVEEKGAISKITAAAYKNNLNELDEEVKISRDTKNNFEEGGTTFSAVKSHVADTYNRARHGKPNNGKKDLEKEGLDLTRHQVHSTEGQTKLKVRQL